MSNKKNIMVMAGTKDAADIIKKLDKTNNFYILATTTTEYGADIAKSAGADEIVSKGLTNKEITEIINKKNIEFLVDATHPFAAEATLNAIKASNAAGTKYIRFERPRMEFPENRLIHKVFSFEEAASKTYELTENRILHLAGVSTLRPIVEKNDPSMIFARVLPSLDSIQKCLDLGLNQENIIAMQGTFSKTFNKALMEEYNISLIVTKESGETGGTPSKIGAALDLGIAVVVVIRPEVPELGDKDVFTDVDELYYNLLKT